MTVNRSMRALLVAVLICCGLAGCGSGDPSAGAKPGATQQAPGGSLLATPGRLSYRDVQVSVPGRWPAAMFVTLQPECLTSPKSLSFGSVPTQPYVHVVNGTELNGDVACGGNVQPADMPAAFGLLRVGLWQPNVTLSDAGRSPDGAWAWQGWTLERHTLGGVQVSVLASPRMAGLGSAVVASMRTVSTDAEGCRTTSPIQSRRGGVPTTAPLSSVRAARVAVCLYDVRSMRRPGLIGSRRIVGRAARALQAAIEAAPRGGGPDRPRQCWNGGRGRHAIVLRFTDARRGPRSRVADVYAYTEGCAGNGMVDSAGIRRLTAADCRPLFTKAPTGPIEAIEQVADLCWG